MIGKRSSEAAVSPDSDATAKAGIAGRDERANAARQIHRSMRAWASTSQEVEGDEHDNADRAPSQSIAVHAKLEALSRKVFRAPDEKVERMPVPPVPPGCGGLADFGNRVMKWGTGDAAALARAGSVTKQEMVAAGVTAALAAQWAAFYTNEKKRSPQNPNP